MHPNGFLQYVASTQQPCPFVHSPWAPGIILYLNLLEAGGHVQHTLKQRLKQIDSPILGSKIQKKAGVVQYNRSMWDIVRPLRV